LSHIRTTYSGLISFIIGLASVFIQLGFLLILTRTLSQEDFGTWGLIKNLIIYGIMFNHVISFWIIRDIARGQRNGTTAILSGGIFSIIGIILYIVISLFSATNSDAKYEILLLAVIIIPSQIIYSILVQVNVGWKPQLASYGVLIFGISQVFFAFLFLVIYNLTIDGIIYTLSIGYIISILFQIYLSREKFSRTFSIKDLRKWLKFSWVPMYPQIATFLLNLDVIIFTIITGSVVGLSYWTAAHVISQIIVNANVISRGLYPKLLHSKDNLILVKDNLRLQFFLSIPLTLLVITFSKPILFFLNPIYEEGFIIVIILSCRWFLYALSGTFQNVLKGIEEVDRFEESNIHAYLHSKLFKVPSIFIVQNIISVISLLIIFIILTDKVELLELIQYWALTLFFIQVPFTGYYYYLVNKEQVKIIDYVPVLKYFLVGIGIFALSYLLIIDTMELSKEIIVFLPKLILFALIPLGGYFGITILIDRNTKKLVKAIFHEIKKSKK